MSFVTTVLRQYLEKRHDQKKSYNMYLKTWSRVLIENLIFTRLVRKLPAFYGTQNFITATVTYPKRCESISHPPTLSPL